MALKVNEQSDEVKGLATEWPMLEALRAGTPAMRQGRAAYLPRWPNEEQASYDARVATATLFPAYQRTVGVMSGKPFAKTLTLSDAPPSVEQWAEDIDLQGVNLHSFAAEMFEETFFGLAGILVDYPRMGPAPNGVRTVAAVEATGARPYFVRVRHGQILGWRSALVAGRLKLTQLRLLESREVEDGEFGTVNVPVVRVLTPGAWATYEPAAPTASGAKEWIRIDWGATTLADIPFVPLYGKREGFMCGKPPLLDLAYLNVKHWQSQSDQDTILHVARVPILSVRGVDDKFVLTVGASTCVNLGDSPNAEMKFVEHTGAAITAGATALTDLESQMIQTGAELLVKSGANTTVVGDANDAEANKSDLQRMAENFQDCMNQALWYMAQYARLPKGGKVALFSDYGAATLSDASATLVSDLNARGLLTNKTTLEEMQRRGVISSAVDVDAEIEAVAAEGPALGTLGLDPVTGLPTDPAAPKPPIA